MKINKDEMAILCREQFSDLMDHINLFDDHDLPPISDFKAALDAEILVDEWEVTAWELLDDIESCCEAVLDMTGWLDANSPEELDVAWSKVPVDTQIYVRDYEGGEWIPRYFAKFEDGRVCAWCGGGTSWSRGEHETIFWRHAKLAENE